VASIPPDVVVVGGGAIGLSIAWRAAQRGLLVTLVDEARGRGASTVAAGMLAPVTEVHFGEEALLALNLASAARYPSFVAELEGASGIDVGYDTSGTLVVARDADERAELDRLHSFQEELGLSVARLSRRECRALEPALAPGIRGGLLVDGDHSVDPPALVRALQGAAASAGVVLVRRRARAVVAPQGRVRGVELDDGKVLPCPRAVLAAGCWSGEISGLPDAARPPVRPVKGQVVGLAAPDGAALVERTVRSTDVYIVPRRRGRVVVGATVEERGFDVAVTAGGVLDLLRAASELVPGIDELRVVELRAGLRPGSPDNAPLLGSTEVDGLAVATGHFRNGILLAPVTGECIASLLESGEVDDVIAPFSPARLEAAPLAR
jgi:glycine oxidase